MEERQIEIPIRLVIFASIFLIVDSRCSNTTTTGTTIKKTDGVKRIDSPLQRLLLNNSLYCTMNCEKLIDCQSFNLISISNGSYRFLCEIFSKVSDVAKMQATENATYYEAKYHSKDCLAVALGSFQNNASSVYSLSLSRDREIKAFCDMETDHGGWTLLQRRFNGSVDFFLDWQSYKQGFGNLNGEFWLGLDNAHKLMKDTNTTLRFDLWDGDVHRYAEYYEALIASESDNYRLKFKGYKGDAGDSMAIHNNQSFTTKDKDNDERDDINCASKYIGAWWYFECHSVNLNGEYDGNGDANGINWVAITGYYRSLSKTEIKIRRNDLNIC